MSIKLQVSHKSVGRLLKYTFLQTFTVFHSAQVALETFTVFYSTQVALETFTVFYSTQVALKTFTVFYSTQVALKLLVWSAGIKSGSPLSLRPLYLLDDEGRELEGEGGRRGEEVWLRLVAVLARNVFQLEESSVR